MLSLDGLKICLPRENPLQHRLPASRGINLRLTSGAGVAVPRMYRQREVGSALRKIGDEGVLGRAGPFWINAQESLTGRSKELVSPSQIVLVAIIAVVTVVISLKSIYRYLS